MNIKASSPDYSFKCSYFRTKFLFKKPPCTTIKRDFWFYPFLSGKKMKIPFREG